MHVPSAHLGGALILYMFALVPGGAAIREGAANRDNTVSNELSFAKI